MKLSRRKLFGLIPAVPFAAKAIARPREDKSLEKPVPSVEYVWQISTLAHAVTYTPFQNMQHISVPYYNGSSGYIYTIANHQHGA